MNECKKPDDAIQEALDSIVRVYDIPEDCMKIVLAFLDGVKAGASAVQFKIIAN